MVKKDLFPRNRLVLTFRGLRFTIAFGYGKNCFGGKNNIFFSSLLYSQIYFFLEVPNDLGGIEAFHRIQPSSGKKVYAEGAGGPFFYPSEFFDFMVSDISEAIMNNKSQQAEEWKRFMNSIVVITVGPQKNIVGFWFEDDVIHEIGGAVLTKRFEDLQHVFESFPRRMVLAAVKKRAGNNKGKR